MAGEDKKTEGLRPEDIEALAQVKSMISGFNEAQLKIMRRFVDFLIEKQEQDRGPKAEEL